MQKLLLGLLIFIALALALFTNMADAQALVSFAICQTVIKPTPEGLAFCTSLEKTRLLWSVVFYAACLIAGLAAASLYLQGKRKP